MTLVSCIMPTCDRRRFVPLAIKYFLRQDYADSELIIVDEGSDPVRDIVPVNDRIHYFQIASPKTIGAKRNFACQQALGSIIAHWDDDDWHSPERLSVQVNALERAGADICGIQTLLFYEPDTNHAWKYVYPPTLGPWLSGSTLCYRRELWEVNPFDDIQVSEDARFVWRARNRKIAVLPEHDFHIGIIHSRNASPKITSGSYWQSCPVARIRDCMKRDWAHYSQHDPALDPVPAIEEKPVTAQEGNISMLTMARTSDLSLPEFAVFSDNSLPRMRRWEVPFALFQARLDNTMAVLDCTINPVTFSERLARLYPNVFYRHFNPIRAGTFVPPTGVPDNAFDRILCINTLEHLLKPQRQALIRSLSRKLKPDGWLIVTCDYYFDSFWECPALLQAGVMRQDRKEVFNGFNKITVADLVSLFAENGLHPAAEVIADPDEQDSTLYRNTQPYPHACIAGVFSRDGSLGFPARRKVLLALLTWNTRDISVDSIRAYVREAHLLRRLGHEPVMCVCDNGSTDGTADALGALKSSVDVPFHIIRNTENFGNSTARNQIIDYMLECDADYLLFMDGDIEVVPFSSFAMLRYMENSGHGLGCIGADSSGQSPSRERASQHFFSIDPSRTETTNLVAWTQYGMFRREVFESGVRFDATEPFDRAGWGFEDNDLAFQMEMKGYANQRFFGMVYLHRNARSSMRIMRTCGIDPAPLFARRKQYVIEKWRSVPQIESGPLTLIRQVSMPG